MAEMPNPFVSSSVDTGVSAETPVVASPSPQAQGAAAGCHLSDPTSSTGGHQGSPASPQEPDGAGDLEGEHRFVLDVEAFMEAIEPPPLFLQGLHELAGH